MKSKSSKQKSKNPNAGLAPYKKPASISKHARIIGKLGGRPKKEAKSYYAMD